MPRGALGLPRVLMRPCRSLLLRARAVRTAEKAVKQSKASMKDPDVHFLVNQVQNRLGAAVTAEEDSRQETLKSLYSAAKTKALQKEGVVLLDLVPERDGWMYNEVLLKLSRRDGKSLPASKFSKATDAVASIHLGNPDRTLCSAFTPVQCVVLDASSKELRIVLSVQSAEALLSGYLNQSTAAQDDQKGRGESSGRGGGVSGAGVRLDAYSKSVVAQRQLACLSKLGEVHDDANEAEV